MSYEAIVCRAKVHPHPNADRIQLANVLGFQVVVGLDIEDNQLGVFFPTDGQLSPEFCACNDLYPRFEDVDGKNVRVGGGFIDPKHRRVMAQNFRGEKSFGFWVPLSYFSWLWKDSPANHLKEGDRFSSLEYDRVVWQGSEFPQPICNKYINLRTQKAAASRQGKQSRRETTMFHMHEDTKQFKYFADDLRAGDIITLTLKMHGTSGRYSHTLDSRDLTWWEKILVRFGVKIRTADWRHLNGSRRVILEKAEGEDWYGTDEFRYNVIKPVENSLLKGETLFYEIVGYVDEERLIMSSVSVSTKDLPSVRKTYGDTMAFTYGCLPGMHKMYVYRITRTNEDGVSLDLPWPAVKARCTQLGIEHVPDLTFDWYDGLVSKDASERYNTNWIVYNGDLEQLQKIVDQLTEGPDPINPNHIREGVVIRVDRPLETLFYKNKSHSFYVLEGVVKSTGSVDLEESS